MVSPGLPSLEQIEYFFGVLGTFYAETLLGVAEGLHLRVDLTNAIVRGRFPNLLEETHLNQAVQLLVDYEEIEVAEVDDSGDPGGHPPEDALRD